MPQTDPAASSTKAIALTPDEIDDAAFRASDLAWAVVLDEFTKQHEETGLTYKALGDRIGRSKSQVQRWLSSPFSMNIRSLGLLAEGLDVDLVIELKERIETTLSTNYLHPAEEAKSNAFHAKLMEQCLFDISAKGGALNVASIRTNYYSSIIRIGAGAKSEKESVEWEAAFG